MIHMKTVIKKFFCCRQGVTLLELMVAVTLFSVVMLSVTQIFNLVTRAQRDILASKNVQEDMRYFMEVMAKEIRMARVDREGDCVMSESDKVYYTDGENLQFLNSNGRCVRYFMHDGDLMVNRGQGSKRATSKETEVRNLEFIQFGEIPLEQPRIVVTAEIETGGVGNADKQTFDFQTSLSARYYE